jgi:hypothetical protein
MAFPATYNISYYRGDTYVFVLNPKNSDGTAFDLNNYSGAFQIKSSRNPSGAVVLAGTVSVDTPIVGSITCAVDAEDGQDITAGTYVYDVEIEKTDGTIYTLVTGNFVVTDDVTRTA